MIDSTVADQWIFDAVRNLPLGRPTLTISIDVYSRMPLAVVVTFEPPSLYTAGRAIYETCRPKHDWRERFPTLTRDYDGWGKPRTVLVDNAWEQVGVSFQDAYEDVGISIEWAPVATPEYKALGERFFSSLNTLVHHRSRGGVPFPPHLIRKFKLDPAKDTIVELTDYEELIHQAIVEVYQTKVHTTLGKPPALAWRESKASHTRPFINDLRQLRTLVGAVARATVRRDGVRLRGHRFHDEHAVTRLLDALARTTPIRCRPKGGATAGVKVKYDPADCSFVDVWNPVAKNYERLSNVDKRFTRGDLSFKNADDVRAWAKVENLAFESDEDRWKARNGLRSTIERVTAGDVRFTYIRNARRLLHPAKAISGDVVETVTAMATAAGLGPFDVEHRVAMHARDDDGMPEKGPPRGKPKRPKRPRKQAATSAGSVPSKPAGAAAPPPSSKPAGSGFDASEIDAAMSLDWVIASMKDQDR